MNVSLLIVLLVAAAWVVSSRDLHVNYSLKILTPEDGAVLRAGSTQDVVMQLEVCWKDTTKRRTTAHVRPDHATSTAAPLLTSTPNRVGSISRARAAPGFRARQVPDLLRL